MCNVMIGDVAVIVVGYHAGCYLAGRLIRRGREGGREGAGGGREGWEGERERENRFCEGSPRGS